MNIINGIELTKNQLDGTTQTYTNKFGLCVTITKHARYAIEVYDKFKRLVCPSTSIYNTPKCIYNSLELNGGWIYFNGDHPKGIQPGKYSYSCKHCHMNYVGTTEETIAHIRGEQFAKMQAELDAEVGK